MKFSLKAVLIILVVSLSIFYYYVPMKIVSASNIFLTISTFLFATFAGFFITRQGQRYSSIRDQITFFDGEVSSLYRSFGHISKEIQEKAKKIIEAHYLKILKNKAWDYHFTHKSNTITSIHYLCSDSLKDKTFKSLSHLAIGRILESLEKMQVARKNMIALYNERVPFFQYVLIYFLALLLLVTLSVIPSQFNILESVLKGAFSTCVIFIILLLHEFDRLRFFEGMIGEHSAQDILDIFSGKR